MSEEKFKSIDLSEVFNEFREYKKNVDNLIDGYSGLFHEVKWIFERIAKLETHKNYQIDENRKAFRHVEDLEKKINILEEKVKQLDQLCDRICN